MISHPLINSTSVMRTSLSPNHELPSKHAPAYPPVIFKERFKQATVTVLISESYPAEADLSAINFPMLLLAPRSSYGAYTEWHRNTGPNALIHRLNYSSWISGPFNEFIDARAQIVVQIYDLFESDCESLITHIMEQCDSDDTDFSFRDDSEYVDLLYDDTSFRKPSVFRVVGSKYWASSFRVISTLK
ncbi:hypothetical protein HYFRA_00008937 [Hymenoscyphus fraxineus]|uniref:Uncharacterized protein n=1 Tax=Hymenoscyphus fraxineus TaxID=746836 RepID=A0A9N9KT90_9HELO|nr:hypothetical protein HYFRA_00008937 [Hymenoscyphus fraxineus]